jgi:hypothetical protein
LLFILNSASFKEDETGMEKNQSKHYRRKKKDEGILKSSILKETRCYSCKLHRRMERERDNVVGHYKLSYHAIYLQGGDASYAESYLYLNFFCFF